MARSFVGANNAEQRLVWIDVAKGVCIALVVLGHAVLWCADNVSEDLVETWSFFLSGLRPLRMPLFFMVSGMLASGSIHKPLRQLWGKTGGLYALYCLWAALFFVKLALPGGRDGLPFPDLKQIIGAFALPVILWYIWALPVFYIIAWLLERWLGAKSSYALIPMLALSIASPWIGHATENLLGTPLLMVQSRAVTANLLWFYVGLKARSQIMAIVNGTTLVRLAVSSGLALFMIRLMQRFNDDRLLIVTTPIVLWAALEWMGRVSGKSIWTGSLAAIGRNTLPIYLMHTFVLAGMTFGLKTLNSEGAAPPNDSLSFRLGGPLLITVALILGCVLADRILAKVGLGFLTRPLPSPSTARDGHRSSKGDRAGSPG